MIKHSVALCLLFGRIFQTCGAICFSHFDWARKHRRLEVGEDVKRLVHAWALEWWGQLTSLDVG